MENYCMRICKYNLESPESCYSNDSQADDHGCPSNGSQADDHGCPPYADDAQYFDIDISLPFSPTDTTPISSSENGDTEDEFDLDLSICSSDSPYPNQDSPYPNQCIDEFDLDLSICSPDSPNPNQCISPGDDLFYQGQLLPLQLIPIPLEYGIDEFDLDLSICSPDSPNPNLCIAPGDDLFYQGQLLPLQLIPTPLEYGMDLKDTHDSLHTSRNVPAGVKTQFPKMLIKTATKLKLCLFGFRKSSKLGMDLQSPCAECGTFVQQKLPSNDSDMGSERSMRLREAQSAIQGAIAYCKQSNYLP